MILQIDVPALGRAGDVVSVKEGYGRNYLIPQKKAVLADPENLRMLEHQKKVVAANQQKLKKHAEEIKDKINKTTLTIARETAEEEKLFGSVTTKDIADALRKEGLAVDRHAIHLEHPIKSIGIYDVEIKLHPEVTGTVKVWVVKK